MALPYLIYCTKNAFLDSNFFLNFSSCKKFQHEHYEQISGTLKSTKSKTSNLLLSVIKTALRGPIQRCCSILIGFLILSFPPQDPDSVGPLTGAEQSIVVTTASCCLWTAASAPGGISETRSPLTTCRKMKHKWLQIIEGFELKN